jgi:hypothetical protein
VSMITQSLGDYQYLLWWENRSNPFHCILKHGFLTHEFESLFWVVSSAERPKPGSGASSHDDCVIEAHTP